MVLHLKNPKSLGRPRRPLRKFIGV